MSAVAQNRKRTPKTTEQVTNEMIQSVRRHLRSLETRGAGEDPWVSAEMFTIAVEAETAAMHVVTQLRKAGYTWEAIGFAMTPRVTGRTMRKRYVRYQERDRDGRARYQPGNTEGEEP